MLSARLTVDTRPLDTAVDGLTRFPSQLERATTALIERREPTLRRDLQVYPPRPNRKIEWSSDRQRRYVMMILRRKAMAEGRTNIAYQRTYTLRDGWYVRTSVEGGKIVATVGNNATDDNGEAYAKYVVGRMNFRSRSAALVPQQRFHAITGWTPAVDTLNEWTRDTVREYDQVLENLFDGFVEAIATRRSL